MIHSTGLVFQHANGPSLAFPDLRLGQGGTMVLRGPSGSGKSTWLALVAGLLAPQAGELLVAGQSPSALPERLRDAWRARTIGLLPQRLHLSAALTVRENLEVAFFASGQGAGIADRRVRLQAALAALGIAELSERRLSQISGGQALRVALARSLLLGPKVILADEPTASLDDAAAQAALRLLQSEAKRHQATLVVATHDLRVVRFLPEAECLNLEKRNEKFSNTVAHEQLSKSE